MGRRLRFVLCWQCVLWFGLAAALAHSSPPPTSDLRSEVPTPSLFAFGQSLFAAGEYYRAIGELQRFLFFQPQHPLAPEAQLTIGLGFFCGERWLQAFEVFRRLAGATPDPSLRAEAALWMAETRARAGDPEGAIRLYQELLRRYPGSPIAWRAAYLIGWAYLQLRQWTEAREAFTQIDADSPYHRSAERIAMTLDPPPDLPHRSPTVARVLSTVLPGAGQIYAGQTLDGLIGLGVHAALIAGTTGAVLAGLEGAAGLGAFFTWGFYRSQMSNAPTLAREYNSQAEERFIGQLATQERSFLRAYSRALPCMPRE